MDNYKDKELSYYQHSRPELLPFVPVGIDSALDIGCGDGSFGQLLKQTRQCEVWGIEPNYDATVEASAKIDRIIHGMFVKDMPELSNKKFDAIFFNDVLEHLIAPEDALDICKAHLSPNGHIIASIPNIRWYPVILSLLRYKDFKYELAGVMDKTHLRFFTERSMKRLFEAQGYTVVASQGINEHTNFTFFNLINRLLLNTQDDMKYPQFVIVATLR